MNVQTSGFLVFIAITICVGKPAVEFEAKYGSYVFEGDMLVTKEILQATENEETDLMPTPKIPERKPGEPFKLPATQFNKYRWHNKVVPYVISKELDCSWYSCWISNPEKVIRNAIKHWEKNTCIRFRKRTNERDYIEFIDDGLGNCYSHVGRQTGRQVIALGKFCRKTGIAIHEIGHALGFFHEQSRPDRDNYVEIIDSNIQSGAKSNFRKYRYSQINDLGLPYDYKSIMHYASDAFAKWPWQTTIRPRQPGVKIGQREELSPGDIKEMNKFYEC